MNPKYLFRAIKFNLPWNSYRVHESLQLHTETVRSLDFWESFLDMMAENRFNVLTLWCLHPFPYMIRPKNFPEACPFSDEELKDWQDFWHGLFGMAQGTGNKNLYGELEYFCFRLLLQKNTRWLIIACPKWQGKNISAKAIIPKLFSATTGNA